MVYDLLQTKDGFLWVSTKDGLNRFDGNNFKILINNPFDSFSLAENTVTALFEDSRGWLWIGTESKGLELYDRNNDRFYHFQFVFKQDVTNFSSDILKILESPDGRIWALQRGIGLVCIEIPEKWKEKLPDEADLTHIAKISRFPMSPYQTFNGIVESEDGLGIRKDGKLVLCTNYRILVINPQNNEIEDMTPPEGFDRIWAFTVGTGPTEGDIYGITSTQVFRIRNGETTFLKISTNKNIQQSTARTDKAGGVWLTIEKKIWYLKAGQAFKLLEPDWILDEMPTALTTDRNGNVWVGTFGYGLRKFNLRKKSFHSTAQGETIWGLWKDNKSNIYCKVFNKLKQYDPITGKLNFDHGFENASSRVLDMVIQDDGYTWLLGREEVEDGNAYFQCFSPDKKRKQLFTFPFNMYTYARLIQARNGTFWMAGGSCQLVAFNPSNQQPSYYSYGHLFPEKSNSVRAYALMEDNSGNLWIGTQQGLIKGVIQHGSIVFQLINSEPSKKSGLSSNTVACLLLDPEKPNDFLWIGTKGGGINRMDLNSGVIQYITTEEGLPNNVIYGLLPGNEGEIWCSTNRGLAKIDLKADELKDIKITTFTAANGLQDNEFNTQAFFKAADGELLFGGIKGFNRFISNEIESDSAAPQVYLVGVEINHKAVISASWGARLKRPWSVCRILNWNMNKTTSLSSSQRWILQIQPIICIDIK